MKMTEVENLTIRLLEGIRTDMGHMNERLSDIDKRFEGVDKRLGGIDQRFESMDKRFEAIDRRFDTMDEHFIALRKDVLMINQHLTGKSDRIQDEVLDLKHRVGRLEKHTNLPPE